MESGFGTLYLLSPHWFDGVSYRKGKSATPRAAGGRGRPGARTYIGAPKRYSSVERLWFWNPEICVNNFKTTIDKTDVVPTDIAKVVSTPYPS
jgi:hypothetical protein